MPRRAAKSADQSKSRFPERELENGAKSRPKVELPFFLTQNVHACLRASNGLFPIPTIIGHDLRLCRGCYGGREEVMAHVRPPRTCEQAHAFLPCQPGPPLDVAASATGRHVYRVEFDLCELGRCSRRGSPMRIRPPSVSFRTQSGDLKSRAGLVANSAAGFSWAAANSGATGRRKTIPADTTRSVGRLTLLFL